jgi:hypothetical protein
MGGTTMSDNKNYSNKHRRHFREDSDCELCRHFQGKKRNCKPNKCYRDDEKLNAIANKRTKRKKDSTAWRG